jgi:hypothetical protein
MFMQDITRVAATPVAADNSALSQGIFGPTLIDSETGWRPAHSLRIGDRVHTLDGGLQRIAALSRRIVSVGERAIKVSGGYFDADDDVLLLPTQGILLQTMNLMTAPYARLQARALANCLGAAHAIAPSRAEIVTPIFAEEEVIWAQSGLLLLCPGVRSTATAFPEMHAQAATLFLTERSRRFA